MNKYSFITTFSIVLIILGCSTPKYFANSEKVTSIKNLNSNNYFRSIHPNRIVYSDSSIQYTSNDTSKCIQKTLKISKTCTNNYSYFSIEPLDEKTVIFILCNEKDTLKKTLSGEYEGELFKAVIYKENSGFPLIKYKHDIEIIRIGLYESELLIDKYRSWFGSVFIIGSGDTFQLQEYYMN
jgi:hypothetical protein